MKTEKPKQYTILVCHKMTGEVKRIKMAASRIVIMITMKKLLEPGKAGKIIVNAEDLELQLDRHGNKQVDLIKHAMHEGH